jgi:uncharacterized protein (TIGR03118 family)
MFSGGGHGHHHHAAAFVTQTNLVTSGNTGSEPAKNTDPIMINPWGIAAGPSTPMWVSDNGSGVATLYDGNGTRLNTPFVIPAATGSDQSAPTGQVFVGGSGFVIPDVPHNNPNAVFVFASEDGGISAWAPALGHTADLSVDNGNADPNLNAVYKGITLGDIGTTPFLYAANFRSGHIEVYDQHFKVVSMPGAFVDKKIPKGFAPFNVQSIANGDLIVTYAKQDDAAHDDVAGAGNGFVDEYTTSGQLVRRFDHGGFLNSPWGVAQIPNDGSWGDLGNDYLVGNFGSGFVDVFSPDGDFKGFLHDDVTGHRTHIDGLWALRFGNGTNNAPVDTVYFTAGTAGESAGLFGSLTFSLSGKDKGDHGDH